jgi:hypothetical protein
LAVDRSSPRPPCNARVGIDLSLHAYMFAQRRRRK